jgi:hypothetical protein
MVIMHRRLFRPQFAAFLFALLILTACAQKAQADEDIVHFGSSIHVAKDVTAHDVVCFFCSVHIEGNVNGDTVVFFGNVDLDGSSNHNVVNFFGSVKAGNNSSVGQDLVNFFGSVRLGENVTVGNNLVVMFGGLQAAQSANVGEQQVFFPAWIFWVPFLVIFGGISIVVGEYRAYNRRRLLRGY